MTARVIRAIFAFRVLADHDGGGSTKVGGRRQEARPERPGHAWPITNRLAGARVWPRRPATSPRVPRSRADPPVWPGRERGRGSCGRSGAWRPARGRWRGSGCGRRCGGSRGGSGSARRPPDRRCATPCASGGWGCRRGGRPAGCRGRGAPAALASAALGGRCPVGCGDVWIKTVGRRRTKRWRQRSPPNDRLFRAAANWPNVLNRG